MPRFMQEASRRHMPRKLHIAPCTARRRSPAPRTSSHGTSFCAAQAKRVSAAGHGVPVVSIATATVRVRRKVREQIGIEVECAYRSWVGMTSPSKVCKEHSKHLNMARCELMSIIDGFILDIINKSFRSTGCLCLPQLVDSPVLDRALRRPTHQVAGRLWTGAIAGKYPGARAHARGDALLSEPGCWGWKGWKVRTDQVLARGGVTMIRLVSMFQQVFLHVSGLDSWIVLE